MGTASGVSSVILSSHGGGLMESKVLGCSAVALVQGFRRLMCTTAHSRGLLSDCIL